MLGVTSSDFYPFRTFIPDWVLRDPENHPETRQETVARTPAADSGTSDELAVMRKALLDDAAVVHPQRRDEGITPHTA